MDLHKLMQLLKSEEDFKLDFKLRLSVELDSEKKELAKDVSAIANTPGGRGYIVFGIEDQTRRIVGLENILPHIEERIQQVIANRVTPPIPIRFELLEIEQKKVGVLTIFKSMQVPHQLIQTGAFYIRRGSTTDTANRHEIANMLQQFGMLSFENVPCRNSSLSDLNHNMIAQSIGSMALSQEQQRVLLCSMGIISCDLEKERYYPTYGGLLLFGNHPQDFIPQAIVEVEHQGKRQGIEGNIMDTLSQFRRLMVSILPRTYPVEGIMEVVTNALIHRDYWNNAQYIQVQINLDTIRVTNPLGHERYEAISGKWRVNPWLYSRLLLMQHQNGFHIGIGLNQTEVLFQGGGDIQIKTRPLEGLFEVVLPGTEKYTPNKTKYNKNLDNLN